MLNYKSAFFSRKNITYVNGHNGHSESTYNKVMMPGWKKRLLYISKSLAVIFILLFLFRLLYIYLVPHIIKNSNFHKDIFASVENLPKNYASERNEFKEDADKQFVVTPVQKYEKFATIKSSTPEFTSGETRIKKLTKQLNGVIQYEKKSGTETERELYLLVAVNPGQFDEFYREVQKIGVVEVKEVTKVDKTSEYLKLTLNKAVLEKALSSLNNLKSNTGRISAQVSLQNKMLEIETKLQALQVLLRSFAAENEFSSIRFSLYEGAKETSINLKTINNSLMWTIKNYTVVLLAIAFFIILGNLEKFNLLKLIMPGK